MELIGRSGDSFLVGVGEGMHNGHGPYPLGQVYNRRAHTLGQVMPVPSIVTHASWFAASPPVPDELREAVLREVATLRVGVDLSRRLAQVFGYGSRDLSCEERQEFIRAWETHRTFEALPPRLQERMVEIEAAAIARGVVPLPWTFLAAQMRASEAEKLDLPSPIT